MPGLVPGIHVFRMFVCSKDVDGRDEPGHDGLKTTIRVDFMLRAA
jgi:hypothetical protein